MKTGAIYVRVSTEDQAREGYSIDAQLKEIKKYAKEHNIFIDPKYIFKDEGISGRKAEKRPAFMEMIKTAKSKPKPFDCILVHKLDRFARSRKDSIVYKSLLKEDCKIDVISITENIGNDKNDVILEAVLESMAEYYSLNLSDEVKKGQLEKHSKGGFQTCPSLGYKVINKELVVDEEEAKIVKYVFEEYTNKNTPMLTIAKQLNELGYRTKKKNKFENRSIYYILNNPIYIGKLRYTPGGRNGNLNFTDENTIFSDGTHPSIIDMELWNKTQNLLNKNKKFKVPHQQNHNIDCWLKGIIRCKKCNCTLVKTYQTKLRCNGYNKGKCENSHTLDIKEAKQLIADQLRYDMQNGTINNIVHKSSNADKNNEYDLIKTKLKQIDSKFERIKYAFIEGIDTPEEYKNNKEMLQKEKENLETELKQIKTYQPNRKKEILENGKNVYSVLMDEKISEKEKNDIIRFILYKVEYDDETNSLSLFYN